MLSSRMRGRRSLPTQRGVAAKKSGKMNESSPLEKVTSLLNEERLKIRTGEAETYSCPKRSIDDIRNDISRLFGQIRRPVLSNRDIALARSIVNEMKAMVKWEVHRLALIPLSECDEKQISDLAKILSTAREIEKSYIRFMRLHIRKGGVI